MTMTLSRKPPTILIIEDDPVSSNLLKNIFSNEGYLIREATDGIKGLETALIEPPDLICLDVILPGLSGYEVCRSIRQEAAGANIPILMITSLTKREDIVKGLKSGATDYITKPFSSVEVLARVKVNLDHRFAIKELLERSGRFELACDVLETTTSSLDLKQVLFHLVSKTAEFLNGDRCSIISVEGSWGNDEDIPTGRLLVSHEDPNVPELTIDLVKYPEILKSFRTGEVVVVEDVLNDPLMEDVKENMTDLPFRSVMALPLAFRGEILGAMLLRATRAETGFTHDEIVMARIIAGASTNALRNAALYQRIAKKNEALERMNEELSIANQELENLSLAKSDFVSMVSHELRTPLTSIIGFSELLAEAHIGELSKEQEEYIRQILRKGKDLLSLINDLLDTGRLESGKLALRYREVDLEDVILSVRSSTRHVTESLPTINTHIPEDLPAFEGDTSKITQVLTNLVTNALKFSPPGSPVDIIARKIPGRRESDRGNLIQISVKDRGIGIPEEERQRIFDQFIQVQQGSSRTFQGAGLGLYICKSFVELHGGKIWVDSNVGEGSTFHFTIPIKQS
jgi:signal transduction histidine kinase/DNA-binding response OmpR family regulator